MALTGMTVLSNVSARIISAAVNFLLNRKFVFGSHEKLILSAAKYAALAAVILILNTCMLKLLIMIGLPYAAAKILTETIMFFFSWTIQKLFVFKEDKT